MPVLHELSDREFREKVSMGELSDKKATIARALGFSRGVAHYRTMRRAQHRFWVQIQPS